METDRQKASARQIHNAIDHLRNGEFKSAITLASAAEGVLPEPQKPYLFQKIKKFSESLPDSKKSEPNAVNAMNNWPKHGTHKTATVSEQDVIESITRAISKFIAVHDGRTEKMKEFSQWATQRLQGEAP